MSVRLENSTFNKDLANITTLSSKKLQTSQLIGIYTLQDHPVLRIRLEMRMYYEKCYARFK